MFYSIRCEEQLAAHVQFISTSTLIYLTSFLLMLSLIPVCVRVCVCRYLEYVRIPHTEPIEHEFRWGQRADAEVSKVKILEFMGEVSLLSRARLHLQMKLWLLMMVFCVRSQLHEQDPKTWTQQYRQAHSLPNSSQASTSSSSQR